jgi:hypothetical protein
MGPFPLLDEEAVLSGHLDFVVEPCGIGMMYYLVEGRLG